jgi:hypothetical protein
VLRRAFRRRADLFVLLERSENQLVALKKLTPELPKAREILSFFWICWFAPLDSLVEKPLRPYLVGDAGIRLDETIGSDRIATGSVALAGTVTWFI